MSEHQQQRAQRTQHDDALVADQQASTSAQQDDGFDALLDEIDGLLENNAADYVRSFVQKGGQ